MTSEDSGVSSIVQFSILGRMGRLGNQIIQYCFSRAYAEKYGAILETPPWIGEKLFQIEHPRISCTLPQTGIDQVPWGEVNIDLKGWFQHSDFLKILTREKMRSYLQWRPEWREMFPKPSSPYTVCNVRRGDYMKRHFARIFCLINKTSYESAMQKFGTVGEVKWVSDEYPPRDMGLPADLYFMPDLMDIVNADVIYRANSSFSWFAAELSDAKVYSPLVEDKVGWQDVEFVEGNWPRICDNRAHERAGVLHKSGKSGDLILGEE